MNSFSDIKTIQELIAYIAAHGMPTDEESVCRMQDIVGHSTIEELDFLANNIGRCDEHGNIDPKGSCSGGKNSQKYFYPLIFSIWNWEDAVRFWNQHTNPDKEILTKTYEENRVLKKRNEELTARRDELLENEKLVADKVSELMEKGFESEKRIGDLELENIRLKARLYDMMTAEEAIA